MPSLFLYIYIYFCITAIKQEKREVELKDGIQKFDKRTSLKPTVTEVKNTLPDQKTIEEEKTA